jgi:TP901 family phage tail tape measure protein
MADIKSNINIDINTSNALASLRLLQREISQFQQTMSKTGAISSTQLSGMQQNLVNSINSTGQFSASIQRVSTSTETFTRALETNKLSMGQYFKFAGSQVVGFRKIFSTEFDTIDKVARERVKTLQTQYIKLGRDASGAMQAISVRPQVLDMNDLGTKTAMAAQKAQLFNQLMKQGSTDLLNFGKNTQWAGRQLMVGFTIPLGIMGAAAAREFKAIEEQVIRLERVYGDFTTTVAETEKVTEQVKGLADEFTKYGVAVSKTLSLAADAAAMGNTGAELIAQVTEANRLAVLGAVSQEQSLETTISLTSAFGTATEDLTKKIDFLNAVENQTITSIEDLTEAIPKAGPVVQQLGGDVEDLTFFLTAMREGGINASEGANALKSGLASMINPTREAVDQLNDFGINIEAIRDANAGDVASMVKELATELNGLTDLNRAQAIETMFGKFQFARMSTLFQNVVAEGSQANRVLDLTKTSAEELAALSQRELSKLEASPLYQFQGAIERFKASLAPIGEEFMKAVTPLINFGTDVLNKFNEMSDGGKQFVVILTGAVAGIGPVLLMTFGLIANGVANLIKLFQFLSGAFTKSGTGSKILAQQTDYMTQQQLEAAAVATSLGQVHTNLIQTFNVEAAAVRNLAAAYGQAVAAQGQFTGPIVGGGRGAKPKKMARGGVLKGRGTGTSDSIPAMLSNGEAIIPAKSVARYPEMVAGLIAGNIPGFSDGTILDNLKRKLRGAPAAIAKAVRTEDYAYGSFGDEEEALIKEIKRAGKANGLTPDEIASQIKSLRGMDRSHIGRSSKEVDVAGKKIQVKDWRTQDIQMDHRSINQYAANLQESSAGPGTGKGSYLPSLDRTGLAQRAGIDPKNRKEMDLFNKEMDNLVAGGHPTTPMGYRAVGAVAKHQAETEPGNSKQAKKRRTRASGVAALIDKRMEDTSDGSYLKALEEKKMNPKEDKTANAKAKKEIERKIKREEAKILAEKEKEGTNQKAITKTSENRKKATKKIESEEVQEAKAVAKKKKDPRRDYAKNAAGKYYDPNTGKLLSKTEVERRQKNEKRRADYQAKKQQPAAPVGGAQQPARRTIASRFAGKGGMIGMGVSGAMMAASSMGGPVGDVLGTISGPLMGASMALQMLPGPIGIVVAGLAAVGAAAFHVKQTFDGAMNKAIEFGDTLGTGTNAMNRLAEFTGSVTGSQQKDLQREAQMAQLQGVADPSIGKQFLETEAGKAMTASIAEGIKAGGTNGIANQVYQQMATGIATGAVDPQTAKSIVNALSEQMKDPSLAILVNGKLDTLVGPNGENLTEDRLEISLALGKESQTTIKATNQLMNTLPDINAGIADGIVKAGVLIGTGAAVAGPWGAVAGGVAALGVGIAESVQYAQKLGEASGAVAANGVMALQQNQALLDSLDVEYEKRIQNAIAAGDLAKAEELQTKQSEDRTKLIEQNAKTIEMATAAYDKADKAFSGVETAALGQAVDKAIETTFADDPLMQTAAVQARGQIASAGGLDNTQEYTMKLMLATGDIPPQVLSGLLSSFGEEEKVMDATMNILTNLGTADGGQLLAIANSFTNPDGTPKTALQQDFLLNFQDLNPEESKEMLDFYNTIQMNGGNLEAVVSLSMEGQEELKAKFDEIEDITQGGTRQVTYQQIVELDPDFNLLEGDQAYFDSLPPLQQKIFLERYVTMFETVNDKDVTQWWKDKNVMSAAGMIRRDDAKQLPSIAQMRAAYSADAGRQAVEAFNAANAGLNNQGSGRDTTPRGGGGGGGRASEPDLPTEAERYRASLNLIADQEEKINEKYDARLKSLDEIQKAQEAISEQQRDQLDLADALTKGDVAAAARSMQAMRANEARRAQEAQKEALEKARERELSKVTYGGLTRKQLQDRLDAIDAEENRRVAAGQARAAGGYISGPGNANSDSIPARLSNGEYVIRASAVKAMGIKNLDMINRMKKSKANSKDIEFSKAKKIAMQKARELADKSRRFSMENISAPTFKPASNKQIPDSEQISAQSVAQTPSVMPMKNDNSVYNYSINVNASTNANPNQIADAVMSQIRNIQSKNVRRNYVSG